VLPCKYERRDDHSDYNSHGEVRKDRNHRYGNQNERICFRHLPQPIDTGPLECLYTHHEHDSHKNGYRDLPYIVAQGHDEKYEQNRCRHTREPPAAAGGVVDDALTYHRTPRHPAEESARRVSRTQCDRLPVGVPFFSAHLVEHGKGQQGLYESDCCHDGSIGKHGRKRIEAERDIGPVKRREIHGDRAQIGHPFRVKIEYDRNETQHHYGHQSRRNRFGDFWQQHHCSHRRDNMYITGPSPSNIGSCASAITIASPFTKRQAPP